MDRLSSADIETLADVVHDIGELRDLGEFRSQILGQMRRLVDCDVAAYNEVGATPDSVAVVADPAESLDAEIFEGFAAHIDQHPLVAHHASNPAAPAARLSDFIGARELHGLELYDLVYRLLGTEHQAAITVPAADRVIGITVSRAKPDFDDSELGLLDAIRPFLLATLRNLRTRGRIEATLAALEHARTAPAAILLVTDGIRIEGSDERAERWLGPSSCARAELEAELESWARALASAAWDIEHQNPSHTRVIDHPEGPHRARFVPGNSGRPAAILIDAHSNGFEPTKLAGLGLTRRQSEVLQLVRAGRTNAEVAHLLGLSERTVAHHLEHVYRRLGVSTRTAAVRRADDHLSAPA
jgi:DNA-binding CsgD family transcriptional regulator